MEESGRLVIGVDTHKATHSAALVDELGGLVAATDVSANGVAMSGSWSGPGAGVHAGPGSSRALAATAPDWRVFWPDAENSSMKATDRSDVSMGRVANRTKWTPSRSPERPWLVSTTLFPGSVAAERQFGSLSALARVRSARPGKP